jgi:hypothetical protein
MEFEANQIVNKVIEIYNAINREIDINFDESRFDILSLLRSSKYIDRFQISDSELYCEDKEILIDLIMDINVIEINRVIERLIYDGIIEPSGIDKDGE